MNSKPITIAQNHYINALQQELLTGAHRSDVFTDSFQRMIAAIDHENYVPQTLETPTWEEVRADILKPIYTGPLTPLKTRLELAKNRIAKTHPANVKDSLDQETILDELEGNFTLLGIKVFFAEVDELVNNL